jgi:hypothetical protein
MPADVDTFSMLRPNILDGLTPGELEREFVRSLKMMQAVIEYQHQILGRLLDTPQAPS